MGRLKNKLYSKVIDEQFIVPVFKGGCIIRFEAWELNNEIIKYNMVYINKNITSLDNGKILGYDNAHNFHHKHKLGDIIEINDFSSYENLVERFKEDTKEFIQW